MNPSVTDHLYRINLIDHRGAVSTLAPPHIPKMLTAVAGLGFDASGDLLSAASGLDADWADTVRRDLMLFDEFNVDMVEFGWLQRILQPDAVSHRTFRVIDDATRDRSQIAGSLGLIVFNLKRHRIIQVLNSGPGLQRQGQGRYRTQGEPDSRRYSYVLPDSWLITP